MRDRDWSPDIKLEDKQYNIEGKLMNDIGEWINDLKFQNQILEQQIKDMERAAMENELAELRLRDKNPALKDVWDQYQTVLALVESGKPVI